MLFLLRIRRTNSSITQRHLSLNIMLRRRVIMRLPHMNSLHLRILRLHLRVRRILIHLRLQMHLRNHLRIRRHTKRHIFNNNALSNNHIQIHHNHSNSNTHLNRLNRRKKFVPNMPLSHFSRIQCRINTLLRLRISLYPTILRTVTRHSRHIMNASHPRRRHSSSSSSCHRGSPPRIRSFMSLLPPLGRSCIG